MRTPGVRATSYGPGILGNLDKFVPMPNPPNGKRFAHWRAEMRARIGVRFGVGVDDPAFAQVLRNARKKERQAR